MGKMIVLKPVVWNDKGYLEPAGLLASSGYASEHGYGHEEWNGRPDWIWRGSKVFHTQGKGRMFDYARDGNLGIIMTTMVDGRFFAVGVGCNVYENKAQDQVAIAHALGFKANGRKLWEAVAAVRKRKRDRADFDRHWRGAYQSVQWRCPQTHFAWFDPPIPIIPNDLIPSRPRRKAIVKMHSSYQAIRPDQALAILSGRLAKGHAIRRWLETSDFDLNVIAARVRRAPRSRGMPGRTASAPSKAYVRYLTKNEIRVPPRHDKLQKAFEKHLADRGASGFSYGIHGADLRYVDPRLGAVLVEVKPTDIGTSRYAIRTAIGQLLDYRQRASDNSRLLIVIDREPDHAQDKALAHDNGFGLAWRVGRDFVFAWP
jgi:hypothetical protein